MYHSVLLVMFLVWIATNQIEKICEQTHVFFPGVMTALMVVLPLIVVVEISLQLHR